MDLVRIRSIFLAQGGSGGYTKTVRAKHIAAGTSYSIVIGGSGGNTSGFGESASRGESWKGGSGSGSYHDTWNGGNGGSDGSNGGGPHPGSGQGTTTREFGESGKTLYSGGGGGGCYNYNNNSWKGGTGGSCFVNNGFRVQVSASAPYADIAPMVERLFCKQRVLGSSPCVSSIRGYSSVGRAADS